MVAALLGLVVGAPTGLADDPLRISVAEGRALNEFYRDGPVAAHMVLRSGDTPRFLVAFPAGNSGVALWFSAARPLGGRPKSRSRGSPRPSGRCPSATASSRTDGRRRSDHGGAGGPEQRPGDPRLRVHRRGATPRSRSCRRSAAAGGLGSAGGSTAPVVTCPVDVLEGSVAGGAAAGHFVPGRGRPVASARDGAHRRCAAHTVHREDEF